MKHLDEYRDKRLSESLLSEIRYLSKQSLNIMEVCGGHTMAIRKYGIQSLIPNHIQLYSGPGCPVCVTNKNYIDKAIEYARSPETIITTYGDLMRVPGTESSLLEEKAKGADVRIIYSTLDAIKTAEENPQKRTLFLGIGFETTAPSTAVAALEAKKRNLKNFFIFSAHKIMPPAMAALIDDGTEIDAYLGPGHVSTIAGAKIYEPLVDNYNLSVVISGFEPVDILQSILMLVRQKESEQPSVQIQYNRAVTHAGNIKAQEIMDEVFCTRSDSWRGIGIIKDSGLTLNSNYSEFDIEKISPMEVEEKPEHKSCLCGEILKGKAIPTECKLFRKVCTPEKPIGACMVSSEGTCAAYFKYSL